MLAELRIRDFAIIDRLELNLAPGFSVLTGETGAGKSIIIDAVELVLGARADTSAVRAGAERANVEAVFRLSPERQAMLDPLLEQEGLEGDDPHFLLLGREVRVNGRNVCRVNGRAVTLSLLREIAEGLVDIHGQSEHLSLMRVREHVNLLDRYSELWPLRSQMEELVRRVRSVRRELNDLLRSEQELAHRADLLQFQIDEIGSADLRPGEEEELREARVRLSNAEQLAELVGEALGALEQGDPSAPGALDLLGVAARAVERLARIDAAMDPQLELAESATYQVDELVRALTDYQAQIEQDPKRLRRVEDRLALIRRLERKYGATVPEVLTYAREAADELDAITHSEERIEALRVEEKRLLGEAADLAMALSARRREAARELAARIEAELDDLQMEGARFGVRFAWQADEAGLPVTPDRLDGFPAGSNDVLRQAPAELSPGCYAFDETGLDRVEFLVSPNPGEPLKPMVKIASGGETARLMLALKTVLSRADETPTLIFDEIDQGIGGRVGATVGQKLWGLSSDAHGVGITHQVLCVTHLPQLAGFGDRHFRVEKEVRSVDGTERTLTRVRPLTDQARVDELAQMLGGSGEAAILSAREILAQVTHRKDDR